MATHERELTSEVDLAAPGGLLPNPAGVGFSRRPLHRDNLADFEGRNKRWDYWCVLAGDRLVSATVADLDAFVLADVWWADLSAGVTGGQGVLCAPRATGALSYPLTARQDGLDLCIDERAGRTVITASWHDGDGAPGSLDVAVDRPEGLESLNVVIPWHDELFNFTSKQWCREATGVLDCAAGHFELGGSAPAWGVLDLGRGRWPARVEWNWGGGSGRIGDHLVGLQFGAKWTLGSGLTENGLLVDGRLSKLGCELDWDYDWRRPLDPWRVVDPGGQLDVTLDPRFDKHTVLNVSEELGTEVHQVFGRWSGWLVDDEGRRLELAGIEGFAEEARQRW